VVTREFQRLMSHFLFASHFCLVRRPNEKGHVERLVEYAWSNFLVPVPQVASLAELNERLPVQCQRDQERTTRGMNPTSPGRRNNRCCWSPRRTCPILSNFFRMLNR